MSCNRKSQINGQKVFNEIFIDTVDSTFIDKRIYLGFGYSEQQKDSIRKDSSGLVIAVNDQAMSILDSDLKEIPETYTISSDTVLWVRNPEKFNSEKYIFKKVSDIPDDPMHEKWSAQYPKFTGALTFSKIYFDPKAENGIMAVSYSCGSGCGLGYLVYISKINDVWKIRKVKRTWIS